VTITRPTRELPHPLAIAGLIVPRGEPDGKGQDGTSNCVTGAGVV
jgi:hypothetical protein